MARKTPVDVRIRALAGRHGGHVHRRQLLALGLTRDAIEHLVAIGFLIPVHRGVYAVGHVPGHPHDRAKGALLAVGPEAALSHRSAGTLWGVFSDWSFPLELSTPRDCRPRGLLVHRNTRLAPDDIRIQLGIRVTSPAVTLLDLAPTLTDRRLERAIDDLRMPRQFVTPEQIEATLARFPRHPGCRVLRRVLGISGQQPTRSAWEQDWSPFAKANGLPLHETNVHVCGHRVDVYFPAEEVIVELDGWSTHRSYAAFVGDRARDAEIFAASGIVTIRLTYSSFHRRPRAEAERLWGVLRRRQRAA